MPDHLSMTDLDSGKALINNSSGFDSETPSESKNNQIKITKNINTKKIKNTISGYFPSTRGRIRGLRGNEKFAVHYHQTDYCGRAIAELASITRRRGDGRTSRNSELDIEYW